jgi:hypothetical protein
MIEASVEAQSGPRDRVGEHAGCECPACPGRRTQRRTVLSSLAHIVMNAGARAAFRAGWLVFVVAGACSAPTALASAPDTTIRILDYFEDVSPWRALASDEVSATLHAAEGSDGKSICLQYDFNGVSGHAAIRRTLPLTFPDNYEFSFRMRGRSPVNDLEFKLIDDSGDNVWWVKRPKTQFSDEWQTVVYRKRHVDFAWGPRIDKVLRESKDIEFTLYADQGGRGEVCFDQLTFRALPLPPAEPPAPVATASSQRRNAEPALAVDGEPRSAWRSSAADGSPQWFTLDLGVARVFGGLSLRWLDGGHASAYEVQISDDGEQWRTARRVDGANGGSDAIHLPESEARYLRLRLVESSGEDFALAELELLPPMSANDFIARIAQQAPRGRYPRGFIGEQTYWTVVGLDGGRQTGLLSEDGAIEVARGGFSIEPFLVMDDDAVVSWADATITHALQDDYLPIPSVAWKVGELGLDITTFADGTRERSRLLARYTLHNDSELPRAITLALAVRPFQVNPPIQFLNTAGGISPIHALAYADADDAIVVDGKPRVHSLAAPDGFIASAFDAGMIQDRLAPAKRPDSDSVTDASGYASGALLYRIALAAGERRTVALSIPLTGKPVPVERDGAALAGWLDERQRAVADDWHAKLDRVGLTLPPAGKTLVDTLRTALAHVLISRHGVEIRPGTRSYGRSWIRDGAMTSEALLRLGHVDAATDFLEWYAPYQFKSGKVPCCVDHRGADPVPENDSHGELIHLIAEVWRYGRDRELLAAMWPHVDRAIAYMDELRLSERTPANREGMRRARYGLMPPSISHEGYSAKPAYSYWDDFWALTGYKHAVRLAEALGRDEDRARLARSRDQFHGDLIASIKASAQVHGIDFIPGAADLGDFDATSTTIALSPAGEQTHLPADQLRNTFERYWREFTARRDGRKDWDVYTPYELRNVSALMRLGWLDRAHEALAWFFTDRRPAAWNQWAEVVGREPRVPRFIGDMPHGWVASDYIRSMLDFFAYERDSDASIVIAAGVPETWLDGEGIVLENLRTPFGELSYTLKRAGDGLSLDVADGIALPPGGLVFGDPGLGGRALLDGQPIEATDGEFRIRALPARLRIGSGQRRED